jgi:hypothetical protein
MFSMHIRYPDRDSNPKPPKYEAESHSHSHSKQLMQCSLHLTYHGGTGRGFVAEIEHHNSVLLLFRLNKGEMCWFSVLFNDALNC